MINTNESSRWLEKRGKEAKGSLPVVIANLQIDLVTKTLNQRSATPTPATNGLQRRHTTRCICLRRDPGIRH